MQLVSQGSRLVSQIRGTCNTQQGRKRYPMGHKKEIRGFLFILLSHQFRTVLFVILIDYINTMTHVGAGCCVCVHWRHLENIRSGESNGCFLMRKAPFCSLPGKKKKRKKPNLVFTILPEKWRQKSSLG